jgi:group I intron endonuclease
MPYKKKESGIYLITNTVNGHRYVGSAVFLAQRWAVHRSTLQNNTHKNPHLQAAYNLYGAGAFVHEILEYVEPDQLLVREQYYLDTLQPEYNINLIAGNTHGRKHSPEARAKMGNSKRGKLLTPEHRAKLSEVHKGVPKSPEHREQIRAAHNRPETKELDRQASLGRVCTPETRAKISENNRKRASDPAYDEWRAKMAAIGRANKGRKSTPEQRTKMSEAHRRRNLKNKQQSVYPGEILAE